MRPRIPDLSGYREKLRFESALNSGKRFSSAFPRRLSRFLKPTWLGVAIAGGLVSFLTCVAAESFLSERLSQAQGELAKIVSTRAVSVVGSQSQTKQNREVSFALFNVAEQAPTDEAKPNEDQPVDAFTLVGTLPNIGAWLNAAEQTSLVLRGQVYNGYTLRAIENGEILLTKDEDSYRLYLNLGSNPKSQNDQASANVRPTATPPSSGGSGGIVKAGEGTPGSINREVIDKLLMNPYDELAKMRLVPTDDGMKLERAANDSLFIQLGIQAGDTIASINRVPLKDLMGAQNAIGSLLNSSQFNLGLVRDSKPMQLDYAIK